MGARAGPTTSASSMAARRSWGIRSSIPSATMVEIFAPARSGEPDPDSGPYFAGENGNASRIVFAADEILSLNAPIIDPMPLISPWMTFLPALYSSEPRFPIAEAILPGIPDTKADT